MSVISELYVNAITGLHPTVNTQQITITSTILSALIEIPSYIFVYLFVDNFGRKPIMVCTLFLTGVSCIPAGYVTGHIQMALSLAGKNQVYIPVLE